MGWGQRHASQDWDEKDREKVRGGVKTRIRWTAVWYGHQGDDKLRDWMGQGENWEGGWHGLGLGEGSQRGGSLGYSGNQTWRGWG